MAGRPIPSSLPPRADWAAVNGDAALAQMLLAAGANIRATTRLGGITALHMASQSGHAQVVAASEPSTAYVAALWARELQWGR